MFEEFPSLRFPQVFGFIPVLWPAIREVFVGKEAVSLFGIEEENSVRVRAESVAPLPMRQCVLLIFVGSVICYGLGFAVVTAFNHLLVVL